LNLGLKKIISICIKKIKIMVKRDKRKREALESTAENKNESKKLKGIEKWKNKQRVLLIASRGVNYLARHLIKNFKKLMPHTKTESKFQSKNGLKSLNEIADMRNCNKVVYIEMHRKQDAFVWLSSCPQGPSAKFLLENVHTMEELRLTGNCLKASRPILSFSDDFDREPHWRLLKELLSQIMGTPHHHPKSQPFIDHVFNFSLVDNKIWIRNYQIGDELNSLAEIGPRYIAFLVVSILQNFYLL
jgi:ribosome biogenesis protein BRX1